MATCRRCRGNGVVMVQKAKAPLQMTTRGESFETEGCPTCLGTGEVSNRDDHDDMADATAWAATVVARERQTYETCDIAIADQWLQCSFSERMLINALRQRVPHGKRFVRLKGRRHDERQRAWIFHCEIEDRPLTVTEGIGGISTLIGSGGAIPITGGAGGAASGVGGAVSIGSNFPRAYPPNDVDASQRASAPANFPEVNGGIFEQYLDALAEAQIQKVNRLKDELALAEAKVAALQPKAKQSEPPPQRRIVIEVDEKDKPEGANQ